MFVSLESWAGSLGYVVERFGDLIFVNREGDSSKSFRSEHEVMDHILLEIRKSCCGAS